MLQKIVLLCLGLAASVLAQADCTRNRLNASIKPPEVH